jgi:hypothetical protein
VLTDIKEWRKDPASTSTTPNGILREAAAKSGEGAVGPARDSQASPPSPTVMAITAPHWTDDSRVRRGADGGAGGGAPFARREPREEGSDPALGLGLNPHPPLPLSFRAPAEAESGARRRGRPSLRRAVQSVQDAYRTT